MLKKVLSTWLVLLLMSQSAVCIAAETHKHVWIDDIENSDMDTNRYYCECGASKEEVVLEIREYVITLDANGGEVDKEALTTWEYRIKHLPIPARSSDYLFEGWFTEPDGGKEITGDWVYDKDMTLYAHWSVVGEYTLTFATDGGSEIRPITGEYMSTCDLKSYIPEKKGYTFCGWYADPRTKVSKVTEHTFTENTTVYAKWQIDPNYITRTKSQPSYIGVDRIYLTDDEIAARTEWLKKLIEQYIRLIQTKTK